MSKWLFVFILAERLGIHFYPMDQLIVYAVSIFQKKGGGWFVVYFTPIDARSSLYSFLFLLQTGLELFTCFSFAHPISMFPMLKKLKPKAFLHIPFMYNVVPISAAAVTESVPPNCKEEPGSFSPLSSTSPFTGTSNSIVNPRLGTTDAFPYLTLMLKEKEKELIWSIIS